MNLTLKMNNANRPEPALTVIVLAPGGLSPRELAVLQDLCQGYTRKEIARRQFRSIGAVSKRVEGIAHKLNAHSAAEIVAKAVAKGIVDISLKALVLWLAALGLIGMAGADATPKPQLVSVPFSWDRQYDR